MWTILKFPLSGTQSSWHYAQYTTNFIDKHILDMTFAHSYSSILAKYGHS